MLRAVVTGIVLLGSASCGPQATLGEEAFAPIKVGVITSLTGDLEGMGTVWKRAAQLASLEANAAGGPLPGRLVELVVRDDQTDGTRGEAVARDLIDDEGVVAIIGAPASSVSRTAAQVTAEAGIPQISCCSTSEVLTTFTKAQQLEERFFFRTAPPDSQQAQVLVDAADQIVGCTTLAVLHLNDSYGTPLGQAIADGFNALGGGKTAATPIAFTDKQDYSTEVTQVSNQDPEPDCIALVTFPKSAGQIVRDWGDLSVKPEVKWIGTDGIKDDTFAEEAGSEDAIDSFFGTAPLSDASTPENNAFTSLHQAVYGEDPIVFSSNQYDAVALLMLAMAQAGSTEGSALRDALREVAVPPGRPVRPGELGQAIDLIRDGQAAASVTEIDYQGASGSVDFDEFGDVATDYEIWRFDKTNSGRSCPSDSSPVDDHAARFCRIETIHAGEIGQ